MGTIPREVRRRGPASEQPDGRPHPYSFLGGPGRTQVLRFAFCVFGRCGAVALWRCRSTSVRWRRKKLISKFLTKRGPGVQQVCFRVDNLEEMIALLIDNGVTMIDNEPRNGAHGALIAFVHPKSTGGVLVELAQKSNV